MQTEQAGATSSGSGGFRLRVHLDQDLTALLSTIPGDSLVPQAGLSLQGSLEAPWEENEGEGMAGRVVRSALALFQGRI